MSRFQSQKHREKINSSRKKNGWFRNPEETKRKMSFIRKGEKHHFFGKKFTEEHRRKISEARKGQKPANFKGGSIVFWKKQALIRDDYTCKVCGLREKEIMEIDHILSKSVHPELSLCLGNLITLCPNDHRRKTNSDRKRYRWGHGWNNAPVVEALSVDME